MTQGFNPTLLDSTPLENSRASLIENDNTLRNNFLGTAHPLTPVDGQFSARSDETKLYIRWGGSWTQISGDGFLLFSHFNAATFDTDPTLAANSNVKLPTQGAVKAYIDNKITGAKWKDSVRAATVAAGTLATSFANGQTIDGVTLATGDRILIKNQASGAENGIYLVNASGAPTRTTDADSAAELVQATVFVQEGTTNADTQWTCTNNAITLGTTALVFAQMAGAGTYTADNSTLQITGNVFSVKNVNLLAMAGLTGAADKLGYFTGAGAMALADFPSQARTLLAATTQAAQRTALGLGSLATQNATGLNLESTTNTVAAGPIAELYRNRASPAAGDYAGQIESAFNSSTGVKRKGGTISSYLVSVTNGAENFAWEFWAMLSGTLYKSAAYGAGAGAPAQDGLVGMNIANNGSDPTNDIDVGYGVRMDSSGTVCLVGGSMTKQLDATWAAGNNQGGRFSGVSLADGWYHFFAIYKTSDGSVDYGFDTSITCANIPSGFSAYKRLGSIKRVSGAIRPFIKRGRKTLWTTAFQERASTSAVAWGKIALGGVPTGIVAEPILSGYQAQSTVGDAYTELADGAQPATPTNSLRAMWTKLANATAYLNVAGGLFTDTSAQIYLQVVIGSGTLASNVLETRGFIDPDL